MNGQPANSEIEKLVQLSKNEKSVKQKKCYDIVLLYLEGRSRREISDTFTFQEGQCPNTYLFTLKAAQKRFLS